MSGHHDKPSVGGATDVVVVDGALVEVVVLGGALDVGRTELDDDATSDAATVVAPEGLEIDVDGAVAATGPSSVSELHPCPTINTPARATIAPRGVSARRVS